MFERALKLRHVGLGIAVSLALANAGQAQQQPDLGPRPVVVADTPYTFDTAEQHGIKVSVVARGLAHPFSLAFLPNGDALVTIRSGGLRLVRNAASGKGGAATLVPQPIGGTPEAYSPAHQRLARRRAAPEVRRELAGLFLLQQARRGGSGRESAPPPIRDHGAARQARAGWR